MPFGWAWLPHDGHDSKPVAFVQSAASRQLPPDLILKSGPMRLVQVPQPHYEIPRAVLTYGETVLQADLVEIYPNGSPGVSPGSGFAHGHVQLTDPVGNLSADEASFNWIKHSGQASKAVIKFEGIEVTAAKVQVEPGVWTLDGVRAGFERGRPIAYVLSSHAILRPGSGLTAFGVDARLLGTRVGGVHRFDAPFDPSHGLGGDHYPAPNWSGDTGFGLRYRPRYLLDDRTAVAGTVSVTQTELPSYGVQIARSYLKAGETEGLVVPRSELDNRFSFGYFDTVGIASPTDEHNGIGLQRYNVSVGAFYNVQAFDRKGDEVFAKPFEATVERAFGTRQSFAVITDNTFQQIHVLGGSDHDRLLDSTTVAFPLIRLAPKLTTRIRFDGAGFVNPQSTFSWVQAQAGLVYHPNAQLRFGVAYNAARQFGTPLYLADELYSLNTLDLRSDFEFGPHRLSLLAKYDTERRRWYDNEFALYQVIGPIEFFARYRTFPSQFVFGGQVRLDSVLNQIEKRNPTRPEPTPKLDD